MASDTVLSSLTPLLEELDEALLLKDKFNDMKQERIALLKHSLRNVRTPEERYWLNNQLYESYLVYDSDSAMQYANDNLDMSRRMNDVSRIGLWSTRKAFILVATGMMHDAEQLLNQVRVEELDSMGRVEYYEQRLHLCSHILLYDAGLDRDLYSNLVPVYKDSIRQYCTPNHPLFLWYQANRRQPVDDNTLLKADLHRILESNQYVSRESAMNAYALGHIYLDENNQEQYLVWLTRSAIADVKIVNREIASLEELSKRLFSVGDLKRAYNYMSYCREVSLAYHNRVRLYSVAQIEHSIFDKMLKDMQDHNRKQQIFFAVVSLMALLLLIMVSLTIRNNRRLHRIQRKMSDTNSELQSQKLELSVSNHKLEVLNNQLKSLNEQLTNSVMQLDESNFVKEEYIGAVFQLCSSYINKMDDFRRTLNRKLKTNMYEDARQMTESPTEVQNVVREFYHSFDAIFLNIYPNFVEEFNELLKPEEYVHLKEGELLTTELRIYALVRMGITDSFRISQVLHCSPQTVYNNRNKTRNKALSDREDFDESVRNLGKKGA